jgi:5-methylcytosine-specific restriction endonuclease McrA
MNDIKQFLVIETTRLGNLCGTKHKKGFGSKDKFVEWAIGQLQKQNYSCFYCETSIFDIKSLIDKKKLRSRKTGYGVRGPVLEIDKKTNGLGYSATNCVLSCYYCNNDKSYTMDSEDYKVHFGHNRKKYFESLIKSAV